jgi:hypothetical protein
MKRARENDSDEESELGTVLDVTHLNGENRAIKKG